MVGELRRQALEDLKTTIQSEFGQNITISRPDGTDFKTFIGNSNDISLALDYETGLMVTGRTCHAILVLKEIVDHFGQLPEKLWNVEFLEISPNKFRIKDIQPDHSLGVIKLIVGD